MQSSTALLATYETAHNSLKDDTQSRVIARQTQAHSFFCRLPEIAFRDIYQTILSQDPLLDTPIIFSTKKCSANGFLPCQICTSRASFPPMQHWTRFRSSWFMLCHKEHNQTATRMWSHGNSILIDGLQHVHRANPAHICCLKDIHLSLGPGKIHLQKDSGLK